MSADSMDLRPVGTTQGKVVIECDHNLSAEQMERVSQQLEQQFPNGVVILCKGFRLSHSEQQDRIEAKLDRLLEALADEPEDEPESRQVRTLDGMVVQVEGSDTGVL